MTRSVSNRDHPNPRRTLYGSYYNVLDKVFSECLVLLVFLIYSLTQITWLTFMFDTKYRLFDARLHVTAFRVQMELQQCCVKLSACSIYTGDKHFQFISHYCTASNIIVMNKCQPYLLYQTSTFSHIRRTNMQGTTLSRLVFLYQNSIINKQC